MKLYIPIVVCTIAMIAYAGSCKKDDDNTAHVLVLNCSNPHYTGPVQGQAYDNFLIVDISGGNGKPFSGGSPIASTGVTGLSATLLPGNAEIGFRFKVQGTPATYGIASFAFAFDGKTCNIPVRVPAAPGSPPMISSIICAGAIANPSFASVGVANNITIRFNYTGGNGAAITPGSPVIASTGVTGLTATFQPNTTTLEVGDGSFTFKITGTPTTTGSASFNINFAGQSCTYLLSVV